ncbi:type VII secretion-associated serine protease mycosin [Saccharothrix variisporea]|uniref:Type VII secretion-associated serine protease mycosin n=2 Tax=Saccharothrix variisporea TaxID=543527 RepID=A0A495XIR0_9PSEU|nr:type VII secretion-associated serine protease mycosin [Saccharothrix variisporea]
MAGTATAAPPPGACHNAEPAHPAIRDQPWAQQLLDPRRVWPRTRGAGVLVAVVDSGVDADHPQLTRPGKVREGRDFVRGEPSAAYDCVSHGTGVAGIIAADPVPGIGFHGLAPDAEILPVRVSERDIGDRGESLRIDPRVLADGIRYAADMGAKVVNLSLAGFDDNPVVREAVAYAVGKDALVVAAVGNGQRDETTELPSFPAGYDGVLGVGAIDINGARFTGSQIGTYVDLVAPGSQVVAPTRVDGHSYVDGTSFAVPFVSATAALVRAAWPELTATQVSQRLLATANPARGGQASPAYGAGLVDPYRAVTDGLDPTHPATLPPHIPTPPDQAALDEANWLHTTGSTAKWGAAVTLAAVVAVALSALVHRHGRRRRWQPTWSTPLPSRPPVVEPPEQTFLVTET